MRLRTNNIIKLSMPHHDYSVSLERKYFKAWSVHSFYEITRQLIEVKSKLLNSACVRPTIEPKRKTWGGPTTFGAMLSRRKNRSPILKSFATIVFWSGPNSGNTYFFLNKWKRGTEIVKDPLNSKWSIFRGRRNNFSNRKRLKNKKQIRRETEEKYKHILKRFWNIFCVADHTQATQLDKVQNNSDAAMEMECDQEIHSHLKRLDILSSE